VPTPPRVSPPSVAPKLSIVVGSKDAEYTIASCLDALLSACSGVDAEIVVVDASIDGTARIVRKNFPSVRLAICPAGTLVPSLWAEGVKRTTGRMVAFTIAECVVAPTWARSLIEAVEAGAAGAGGSFDIEPSAPVLAHAVFYLRYSAFMRGTSGPQREIAGDNACYRRPLLDEQGDALDNGFWEVELHRRIRGAGEQLVLVDGATARLAGAPPFRTMARARFSHGQHFGGWRVSTGARSAWQVVAAAPIVPVVLTFRIGRRVLPNPSHRIRFMFALPLILALAACWAAGEAFGALTGQDPKRTIEVAA